MRRTAAVTIRATAVVVSFSLPPKVKKDIATGSTEHPPKQRPVGYARPRRLRNLQAHAIPHPFTHTKTDGRPSKNGARIPQGAGDGLRRPLRGHLRPPSLVNSPPRRRHHDDSGVDSLHGTNGHSRISNSGGGGGGRRKGAHAREEPANLLLPHLKPRRRESID